MGDLRTFRTPTPFDHSGFMGPVETPSYAEWLLELELNAVTDNPLIFANESLDEMKY